MAGYFRGGRIVECGEASHSGVPLQYNTTGANDTVAGSQALAFNTTGNDNTGSI
jgi:hypothetical protein